MTKAWKQIDLEGGGLQDVNVRMARMRKTRPMAYGLWLLFPLGAHRIYLEAPRSSLIYVALSAATAILWLALGWPGLLPLAAEVGFALVDLVWIDRAVTRVNKALRVGLFMGAGATPPAGYQGRQFGEDMDSLIEDYKQTKERERAGHGAPEEEHYGRGRRIPSLDEQEKMLRELNRRGDD
mgnify:CR=1 FL=1